MNVVRGPLGRHRLAMAGLLGLTVTFVACGTSAEVDKVGLVYRMTAGGR